MDARNAARSSEVTALSRAQAAARWRRRACILTLNWVLFLSALDLTNVATAELLGLHRTGVRRGARAVRHRRALRPAHPRCRSRSRSAASSSSSRRRGSRVAGRRELLGAVLAFCSALTYATLLLRSKKILRGISGMALMLVEYTVASAILLPFVVWLYARGQGPTHARPPTPRSLTLGARADRVRRRDLPRRPAPHAHRPRRDPHLRRAGRGGALRRRSSSASR